MEQKDKELLLKDLCVRLPYGVICNDNRHGSGRVTYIDITPNDIEPKNGKVVVYYFDFDECGELKNCKPYLRPMSSMTKEERNEYHSYCEYYYGTYFDTVKSIDWLNKKMFDYRKDDEGKTMIEKGLALEAPKDMYNLN